MESEYGNVNDLNFITSSSRPMQKQLFIELMFDPIEMYARIGIKWNPIVEQLIKTHHERWLWRASYAYIFFCYCFIFASPFQNMSTHLPLNLCIFLCTHGAQLCIFMIYFSCNIIFNSHADKHFDYTDELWMFIKKTQNNYTHFPSANFN